MESKWRKMPRICASMRPEPWRTRPESTSKKPRTAVDASSSETVDEKKKKVEFEIEADRGSESGESGREVNGHQMLLQVSPERRLPRRPILCGFTTSPMAVASSLGDAISCGLYVGDGCTTVLTTQASTKVYKSLGSKCSEQLLEAKVGSGAILVVIPDPVTCFSTARYSQKQVFRVVSDSRLVLVDWITSGLHESGEIWDFSHYRSTNNIFSQDGQPLFLDTVLLEQGVSPLAERMQDYRVIAFSGPFICSVTRREKEGQSFSSLFHLYLVQSKEKASETWFRELPRGILDSLPPERVMQCQTQEDCMELVRILPPTEAVLLDWAINLIGKTSYLFS